MAATKQINAKKNLVIAFDETTEGTDAVDAALEADSAIWLQRVSKPQWTNNRIPLPRDPARSHRQFFSQKSIASHMDCVVPGAFTEWEGTGAGEEAPTWNMFLLSAGWTEAVVSDTSATYTLDATTYQAGSSMTLWHLIGNSNSTLHRLKRGLGMRGNMTIAAVAGGDVRWNWSGRAANFEPWSDDLQFITASDGTPLLGGDGAALGSSYTGTDLWNPADPMCFATATASWNSGGTSVPISGFTFDPGLAPISRVGASATTVVENVYLDVTSPPRFTVTATESDTVLDTLLAARDADTVADFVITWASSACKITMTFSFAQVDAVRMAEDGNLTRWEYAFVASDDYNSAIPGADVTIAFAAP